MNEAKSTKTKKNNWIVKTAVILFVLLAIAYGGLSYLSNQMEKNVEYTLNELRFDDSTYNYVRNKCDEGFFERESNNCQLMRQAR